MGMEEVGKKFKSNEIQNNFSQSRFSQQRSHITQTDHAPMNSEGIDGELRFSNIGGVRKLHGKMAGVWYSVVLS